MDASKKLEEAISYLGPDYVLHPEYVPRPRHSTNPATYKEKRVLDDAAIARRARDDRKRHLKELKAKEGKR